MENKLDVYADEKKKSASPNSSQSISHREAHSLAIFMLRRDADILHINTEDVHTTELAIEAGKLLGIDLLDHIVVGDNAWISMREQGLAF